MAVSTATNTAPIRAMTGAIQFEQFAAAAAPPAVTTTTTVPVAASAAGVGSPPPLLICVARWVRR
jgi:hypothetical protein